MKRRSLKTGYRILIFSLLLAGLASPVHAASITPASGAISPVANQFQPYTSTTTLQGALGIGNYTWSSANLPAGLTLSISGLFNSICTITGTPTVSGTNLPFKVTVTGGLGIPATGNYTLTINPRCRISGGNTGSILFDSSGNIDPTVLGQITNSVIQQVTFQCGQGTTYSYTVTPTPRLTGAKNTIPFTLSAGAGLAPIGSNTSDATLIPLLTTTTKILQADYQNAYAETDSSGNITVTISWTGAAASSMTATVTASGTVINACSVTGSPALNFNTLDAVTNALGATAIVTPLVIKCTMGDAVTVTSNGGLNYSGTPRLKLGTNYINYIFGFTSPLLGKGGIIDIGGSGAGNLAMNATIPARALDNAPAGTYTDTITLTITY